MNRPTPRASRRPQPSKPSYRRSSAMTLLQRARSFVDPTTNEMVVSDFDLPQYLAWVRGRPVAGSGVLANFLHEWTHRWCFHSPVGSALALLRMRAACRA